jgi:6-phosphogluconolactonase
MDVERTGRESSRRALVRGAVRGAVATGVALGLAAPGTARAGQRPAPAGAGQPMLVYVGTFTGPNQASPAEALSVCRLDGESGALSRLFAVPADNPSFLALHPQQPYLYTVNSVNDYEGRSSGAVSAYAINPTTGNLTFLNRVPSNGKRPIHLSVDRSGRWVLVANITEGNVAVFPIQQEGRLGPLTDVVMHTGNGPNPARQGEPHPHYITTDPSGRYALAVDLGTDRIVVYRLDATLGKLAPNDVPWTQVPSGSGSRHLDFHPNGRWVYVLNELDPTLCVFAFDAERGALQVLQTISTVPDDFRITNYPAQSIGAEVFVHPSGRFVYASNRQGLNTIVGYAVDPETGRLSTIGWESVRGQMPRNFNIDPTGMYLLAANQDSNNIVTFRIDQETGKLTEASQLQTPTPVCIVFRPT